MPIGVSVCCSSAKATCTGRSLFERAVGLCQDADLRPCSPARLWSWVLTHTLAGRVADAVSLLTRAMEQTMAMER